MNYIFIMDELYFINIFRGSLYEIRKDQNQRHSKLKLLIVLILCTTHFDFSYYSEKYVQ